ncbi:MAG: hypothetical protein KBT32_08430 [Bacteroidales bacterium]|nr:hypothetical protein [Candidatus Physcocola equi]
MKTKFLIPALLLIVTQLKAVDVSPDAIDFKKGLTASGGLNFNNTFYTGSDSLINRDPYVYTLCGNLNLNYLGIDLPFSFALSNTSKEYTQPFNRFQVAPKYKWVRLYLGSASMTFSPYTLAGHDFRGVGVELTPKNWYIGAMYGRFLKAVEYDPMEDNLDKVAYKRMGYSAKVGWDGNGTSVNATFFHAKDDVSSLDFAVPAEADLHPKENTAISAYLRQSIYKYFFVQAEYAFSLYNSDIRTSDGAPAVGSTFMDKLFGRKGNDRFVDALNASAGYAGEIWGLSLCYERIAPYYQTLGGYYFTDDKEDYTISPYLKLWKGKINLNGKLGFEFNNLNDLKANDNRRVVGSINGSFSDGKHWTTSLSYSNFSNYTKYKKQAYPYYVDQLDTLNYYQVNQNMTGMVGYSWGDSLHTQQVATTASYQFGNQEKGNESFAKQHIWSGALNFGQSFVKQRVNWGAFVSMNYADASMMESLYWGPGLNGSWSNKDGQFNVHASVAYNVNDLNGTRNSSLLNSNLGASYSLKQIDQKYGSHSLNASLGLTNWLETNNQVRNDYEFLANLSYSVSF